MAGIGFELKKLFVGRGVVRKLRAYAYAGVICSGTMMLAIALLLGLQQMARMFGAGEHGGADVEAGHVITQPRKGAGEGAASAAELRPPAALDAEAAQPPI